MEEDWDTVTYLRKKAPTASQARSAKAINAAQRKGQEVETTKKSNHTGMRKASVQVERPPK